MGKGATGNNKSIGRLNLISFIKKKRSNFQKECSEVFCIDAFGEENSDDATIFQDDSEDALSTSSNSNLNFFSR